MNEPSENLLGGFFISFSHILKSNDVTNCVPFNTEGENIEIYSRIFVCHFSTLQNKKSFRKLKFYINLLFAIKIPLSIDIQLKEILNECSWGLKKEFNVRK